MSTKIIAMCNKNNIEYTASIVTNGFLLNEKLIDELSQLKINNYQITLDGPPNIHNARRKLRGKKVDTFNKILENVKILKSKDIFISIRVNVDNSNKNSIENLFTIFQDNKLTDLNINIGHVRHNKQICSSVLGDCLSNEEYAKYAFNCNKLLKNKNFDIGNNLYYPEPKSNYCCADCSTAFVIDPEGYVYKCWNDVGNADCAISNVKTLNNISDSMYMNNIKYILWSPFKFQKCKECWLLPICMGGCPYNGIIKNSPECEKWKYIIQESLIDSYNKKCLENT
ncbi:radical SAM/SPASM domain-containing protein [Clostridium haemolyticum]|uniref:radical SAM/SPASM domain-containing protein n=1 Tax=Clostridium haemolyticum TaxID=84025 RepID=UPI001FA918CE|nr:SPASM domain-containing protein [Clostridium haemolyticum]